MNWLLTHKEIVPLVLFAVGFLVLHKYHREWKALPKVDLDIPQPVLSTLRQAGAWKWIALLGALGCGYMLAIGFSLAPHRFIMALAGCLIVLLTGALAAHWVRKAEDPVSGSSHSTWSESGRWIDVVPRLTDRCFMELKQIALSVAADKRQSGYVCELMHDEPRVGEWGRSTNDFHNQFERFFVSQLEFVAQNQGQSNVFGNFTSGGPFGGLAKEAPQIRDALRTNRLRFVAGTRANGRRALAVLLLS